MTEKMTHDRTNPREVHAAILARFPDSSAKDWRPAIIALFIPEGADPKRWVTILKNVEYNQRNPKPKRKARRSAGKAPKGHNPGRLVIGQDLVTH